MKRPYREGSRFVVPLGDGRAALGFVSRGTRKVLELAFCAPEPLSVRASDRALRDERWPVIGTLPGFSRADWPAPDGGAVLPPGVVERMLAARSAGRSFDRPRFVTLDVTGGGVDRERLRDATRVQWRAPLTEVALREIEAMQRERGFEVRLYGDAVSQAPALATWPSLARLSLEGATIAAGLPSFDGMESLELDGIPAGLPAVLSRFPRLRVLRVRGRGMGLDAADLRALGSLHGLAVHGAAIAATAALRELPHLRALDVRESAVDDAGAALALPLRALRLARVRGLRTLAAAAGNAALRVLALDAPAGLDDVATIASLALESLDVRGLWQLEVEDVAFVAAMPSLHRLRLDIGGRRKNVEIYRRKLWAEPLPFDVTNV